MCGERGCTGGVEGERASEGVKWYIDKVYVRCEGVYVCEDMREGV